MTPATTIEALRAKARIVLAERDRWRDMGDIAGDQEVERPGGDRDLLISLARDVLTFRSLQA